MAVTLPSTVRGVSLLGKETVETRTEFGLPPECCDISVKGLQEAKPVQVSRECEPGIETDVRGQTSWCE